MAHYQDLALERVGKPADLYHRPAHPQRDDQQESRDKESLASARGSRFPSDLANTPYPAALFYALLNRIRADKDEEGTRSVNYVRAAAIKAYLLRKYRYQSHNPFEEILTMALNEQSTVPAYLLGRLFAVLEIAQRTR